MITIAKNIPKSKTGFFTCLVGSKESLRNGDGYVLKGGLKEAKSSKYCGEILGIYQMDCGFEKSFEGDWHPQLIHLCGVSSHEDIEARIKTSRINLLMPDFSLKAFKKPSISMKDQFLDADYYKSKFRQRLSALETWKNSFGLTRSEYFELVAFND